MVRKRFSEEQIIKALKPSEEGVEVADICRELNIDKQTFYGNYILFCTELIYDKLDQ